MSPRLAAIGRCLFGCAALAAAVAIARVEAPTLWQDAGIRARPRAVDAFVLQDGHCRMLRKMIISDCKGRLAYTVDGQSYARDLDLSFFGFGNGDLQPRQAYADERDPRHATLDIGIAKYWNRVCVVLFFLSSLVGIGIASLAVGWSRLRGQRPVTTPVG